MVKSKRLLSLITSVTLAISLFQFGGVSAKASEEVTQFLAELKDFPKVIHFGDSVPEEPYELNVQGDYDAEILEAYWVKKDGDEWVNYSADADKTFIDGIYRYVMMIHLLDDDCVFGDDAYIEINENEWESEVLTDDTEYDAAYAYAASPEFTVTYDCGSLTIDLSDGEAKEFDGEEGCKIIQCFSYALIEYSIRSIGDDEYDLNHDNKSDLIVVYDGMDSDSGEISITPHEEASVHGDFSVSILGLDEFTEPTYSTITFIMPDGKSVEDPYDKGKLTIDLSKGNKSLSGEALETFLNTIKASDKANSKVADTTTEVSEIDFDGDNRADITASPHTYTHGTYSVLISMHKNCTGFKDNTYTLSLTEEEAKTQASYGMTFYSEIEFIRPATFNTHTLGNFKVDMRGNKTVELKGEEAAAFLATVLYEDEFAGKTTYIYPTIVSENKKGCVIDLDLDSTSAIKADDVILEISVEPELTVKISPLPATNISFYVYTELTSYAQTWFATSLYRDYYTPILFMFADDPNNPINPDQPITPDTPNNPTDPANPTKGGFTPAPLVKSTVPVHSVGDVVVYEGVTYVITSVTAGSEAVTYNKPVSATVTSADIPDAILIDGVAYNVTEISAGCFKGNKKLKKVTIGANVSKIGGKAFYKCKNLKTIKVRTPLLTKANVGSNAFKGLHAKAKVKVPKSQLKAYKKLFKSKGLKGSKQKVTK